MSTTFDIICVKCKKDLWIGQGDILYTGEPETMEKLRVFLHEHKNHPLLFTNDQATYGFMEDGYLPKEYTIK